LKGDDSSTAVLEAERPGAAREAPAPASLNIDNLRLSRLALPLLVAGLVSWVAALTWSSYFYWDDYLYLLEGQRHGLSLGFLVQEFPFGSHLSPGHRFGDWFLQAFFPLNFRAAQVAMLTCFAGTVVLAHLVISELLGPSRRRWSLLLTGLYGTSIVHVAVVGWWGTALLRIPPALLALACIWGWLCFRRTGWRWALVLSVAALVLALGFYVKALLIPAYLLGLRVLVVEPERRVVDSLRDLAQEWRMWLAYLVPVSVYLVVFLAGYWQPSDLPSPGTFVEFVEISWFRGLAPSLAGLYVQQGDASIGLQVALVALQAVIAGLVALSIWRSRRAWRAWVFFAACFLVNSLVVGMPLLGGLGPGIGHRLMYHLEATYLFPIAVAGAFGTLGAARAWPGRPGQWKTLTTAGLLVVVVAHLVAAWDGGRAVTTDSPGPRARVYMENVQDDLQRLAEAGVRPTILDGIVPEYVVSPYLLWGVSVPYHRYSQLFRLIDPALAFDQPAESLFRVADDGHLSAVVFVPEVGGDAVRLLEAGEIEVEGGSVDEAGAMCIAAGASGARIELPRAPRASDGSRHLSLSYTATTPLALKVDGSSDDGSGPLELTLASRPQLGSILVDLKNPDVSRASLDVPPDGRACLGEVELGRIAPGDGLPSGVSPPLSLPPGLDDFDRPDDSARLGGTVGAGSWRSVAGTWGTANGGAYVDQPVDGRSLAVVDVGRSEGLAQVRIDEVASSAGLVVRYRDPSNYWVVEAVPGYATWTLAKVVDGTAQVVADSGASGTFGGTTLTARLQGDGIEVSLGDEVSISVVDATFREATSIGMAASGIDASQARFDDYRAGPLGS
jgi:hypothetical protein